MLKIMKRTVSGMLILLAMPLAVWFTGWSWQPEKSGPGLYILFLITETITYPWGILTSILLSGWFLWCLRFRFTSAIILLLIMSATILAGQGMKSLIKEQVREPRPYIMWMEKTFHLDEQQFYQLRRKSRREVVIRTLKEETILPQWLKSHWAFETGFAFPSGHTFFAVSWALLGAVLLWPRHRIKTVILLMGWAILVMGSRLLLGMHWPQDLVTATLLSGLLVAVATGLVQRFCGPLSIADNEPQAIKKCEKEGRKSP
ncbi:phosphatidylglycerophosphatase B [Enterobacteriaceae bacterium LUAb1]